MGKRCGCVGTDCTCGIAAGIGMVVHGTGSKGNPYILEVAAGATKLVGVGSSYISVDVAGQGTADIPYVITAVKSGLAAPNTIVRVDAFLTGGTYSYIKPAGCTLIGVILIGGGQGGGAGFRGSDLQMRGGFGGAGGGYMRTRVPVSTATSTGTILVGFGGIGSIDQGVFTPDPNVAIGVGGGDTSLTLPDATGLVTLVAGGGRPQAQPSEFIWINAGGHGSRKGQDSVTNTLPVMRGYGGAAGGRGATGLPEGDPDHPNTWKPGGVHPHYASPEDAFLKRIGGNGGKGGFLGGGAGHSGSPGLPPGGGGGGCGYPVGEGGGGRGADGAAWIVSY